MTMKILPRWSENVKKKIGRKTDNRGRPRGDFTPKSLLAQRLQEITEGKNFSEIGALFGVERSTVPRYLKGKIIPPLRVLLNIAQNMGVSLEWLAEGTGEMYMALKAIQAPGEDIKVPPLGRIAAANGIACTISYDRSGDPLQIPAEIGYASVHGHGLSAVAPDASFILLHERRKPRPGEIVAVTLSNGASIVRRFAADEREVFLHPVVPDGSAPLRVPWADVREIRIAIGVIFL